MKTPTFLLFILLICFGFTISCEQAVELEFNLQPTLCLNCVLDPDSTITVRLTKARDIDNTYSFENVEGATVLLTEEGMQAKTMQYAGNGNYHINYKPKPNKKYQILVTQPGFPDVKASTVVPEFPTVTYSADTLEYSKQGQYYNLKANLLIQDKIGKNSYWYYSYRELHENFTFDLYYETNASFIDDFNRQIDTESKYGFKYYYYLRIFDDGNDGKNLDFSLNVNTDVSSYIISADVHYDKYLKSSVKAQLNSEKELPFREPVQIHTNVENGFGIFGSCAKTSISF